VNDQPKIEYANRSRIKQSELQANVIEYATRPTTRQSKLQANVIEYEKL
jgi:hypothetical protein